MKESLKNKKAKKSEIKPVDDGASAEKAGDIENPKHREDFTSLLNEAARKQKQDD